MRYKFIIQKRLWLIYAIIAGLCWGIWGILAKYIADDVSPYMNHILFTLGMLFTLPFVIRKKAFLALNQKGVIWGVTAGLFAVGGNIAVYYAFSSGGNASVVIPLTNLYPIITICIAIIFLKERLNMLNKIGILIALPAILLLSGETLLFKNPSAFVKNLDLSPWLWFSLMALVSWGVFSAAQKVSTNHISAKGSYLMFILTSVAISLAFWISGLAQPDLSNSTISLGALAGMLNGLGVLSSLAAYRSDGKASSVTTIAGALQPVFTIVLAIIFLQEKFSKTEGFGVFLALAGAFLLSYEKEKIPGISDTLIDQPLKKPDHAQHVR